MLTKSIFFIQNHMIGIATVSCLPEEKAGRKPCNAWNNIDLCQCFNGETYNNKKDLKDFCGKQSDNPIQICVCADGTEWTKPVKTEAPCMGKKNIDSCICKDGKIYEGRKNVRRNCKKLNPVINCRCKDGMFWPSEMEFSVGD